MTRKQKAGNSSAQSPSLNKKEKRRIANEVKQMVSNDVNVAKKKTKSKKKKSSNVAPSFGPVSTITTAPVAIGNSVRGAAKRIVNTRNGIRLTGRDFMFSPIGTGSISTWTVCGGSPLTPAAFADSVIANYMRMYTKFKFHSFTVHYITSSATSTSGDVMFYYSKDRSSVFLNQTSSQLLPFVFSDQNTVLGPQWTNHSAKFTVSGDWKLCDYGMHDGIEEYADGEVYLLSKTTSVDSPGYVLFDYDVEFTEQNFLPRLLTFPIPRIQWFQTNLGAANYDVVSGSTLFQAAPIGNNISGLPADVPSGIYAGDIYKVIFDIPNSDPSAWTMTGGTQPTVTNLFVLLSNTIQNAVTISDGFTCYAVCFNASPYKFIYYQNCTAAYAQAAGSAFYFGCTTTHATYNIQTWMSFVGTVDDGSNKPNF